MPLQLLNCSTSTSAEGGAEGGGRVEALLAPWQACPMHAIYFLVRVRVRARVRARVRVRVRARVRVSFLLPTSY
jgi:hypothetical protein